MSIDARRIPLSISKLRMLVIGSINRDVFLRLNRFPANDGSAEVEAVAEDLGGHGANCAVRAAHLGAQVSLMGAVGDDKSGSMLIEDLRRARVDISRVHVDNSLPTGTVFIPQAPDRQFMLMHRGANDSQTASQDLPSKLIVGEFDVVVLMDPSHGLLNALLRPLMDRDRTTLVWAPGGLWASRPEFARSQNIADTIILNRPEYDSALESSECFPEQQCFPDVIVTAGSIGAYLHKRGARSLHVPAFAVDAVDATGAGDAFVAAYSAVAGLDFLTALERLQVASMAGGLATQARGARGGLCSVETILVHLERALSKIKDTDSN